MSKNECISKKYPNVWNVVRKQLDVITKGSLLLNDDSFPDEVCNNITDFIVSHNYANENDVNQITKKFVNDSLLWAYLTTKI